MGLAMARRVHDAEGLPAHSERANRYREQADRFERLAGTETRPDARAQLLRLADEYAQLADAKPRKPTAGRA